MTDSRLPLGKDSDYPRAYAPEVLYVIARTDSRKNFAPGTAAFRGVDVWNAWELTWLAPSGRPSVATAEIIVPADTPNLIESKSLKLYLNSFAMTRFDDQMAVEAALGNDLSTCAGGAVSVRVDSVPAHGESAVAELSGTSLDNCEIHCDSWQVNAGLLQADDSTTVEESLHTHLLRSLCPVTGQPDIGSLQIHYRGPKIDTASLLRYIVSFREHDDFHEACIERMFVDIHERCRCEKLSVYARYQRRGGIDINPFRSNFEDCPGNLRLWRQ